MPINGNGQPAILQEVRQMLAGQTLTEIQASRMTLALTADMFETLQSLKEELSNHRTVEHPDIEVRLGKLEKRDNQNLIASIVVSVIGTAGAGLWAWISRRP